MKLPKMLVTGGMCSLAFCLFGFFFAVPKMINNAIKDSKGLKVGTMGRDFWEKFPYPLFFNVYLLNVTNPQEVHEGGIPVLEEIGPYSYDMYMSHVEVKDRNKDDTMTARTVATYFWNQQNSGKLTGEEMVTLPQAMLLTMVTLAEREQPGALSMVNKAVVEMFQNPKTVYMTVRAQDLLFDGIPINCTVKEFASKAVCAKLAEKAGVDFKILGEKLYAFSFFGMKNGTASPHVLRVKRGIKNYTDVAKVVEFNGQKELTVWSAPRCNNITGTDGTMFRPFIEDGESIDMFAGDTCRSFTLTYAGRSVYQDIPVSKYTFGFGDMANEPENQCFCRSNTTCPQKGGMDMTKCAGTPIVVTLPHFLNCSEEYINGVKGLNADPAKHAVDFDFETITGNPLAVKFRMMFNIEIKAIKKIPVTTNLRKTMHPIFWIEQGIVIPEKFIVMIRDQLLFAIWLTSVIKWTLLVASFGMIGAGRWLQTKEKSSSEITTVVPFDSPKKTMMDQSATMVRY